MFGSQTPPSFPSSSLVRSRSDGRVWVGRERFSDDSRSHYIVEIGRKNVGQKEKQRERGEEVEDHTRTWTEKEKI